MLPPILPFLALGPFLILILSIAFIIAAIAIFRVHAFFAMMSAAILVSMLSLASKPGPHIFSQAIAPVTLAFGTTAGNLGFTLALAAVIGISLMESGAADKIVRCLIRVFGEKNAGIALLVCSFILAGPVFIDTVLMLLLPLARALSVRTKKNSLYFVLATSCGGIITNGTVPPAPGPLYVAEHFKLNLFIVICAGIIFGIIPSIVALIGAKWFDKRMPIPLRATKGETLESLTEAANRNEEELPGFFVSIMPIVIPFTLIAVASTLGIVKSLSLALGPTVNSTLLLLGDKHIALLIGAVIAVSLNVSQRKLGWRKAGTVLSSPLETAAMIILIIAAGSAYGESIKAAGLGDAVRLAAGGHAINYIFFAWLIAVVLRGAQGSATVAVIASTGIITSIAGSAGFGVHPLYILLAIGYGSKAMSWMNDAGFWLVSRTGGLTQSEALKSWSVLATIVSLVGLLEVLAVSHFIPQLSF